MKIYVEASSRIHMGLIDMGRCLPYAYGGIGISLAQPRTLVTAEPAAETSAAGLDRVGTRTAEAIVALLGRLEKFQPSQPIRVTVVETVEQHVGLGSTTALMLSVVEAYLIASRVNLSITERQRLTGRGGASGVGINTFYTGGVVRDCGRAWSQVETFAPSRDSQPLAVPAVQELIPFPSEWSIMLLRPKGSTVSGNIETSFFRENTPIPCNEVHLVSEAVDDFIVPALKSQDFEKLRMGTIKLSLSGFKMREIANQPANVKTLLEKLQSHASIASGMSSFGPTLYAIFSSIDSQAKLRIQTLAEEYSAHTLLTSASRLGAGHIVYEQ